MLQVRIVPSLSDRLIQAGLNPNQLLQDFSDWKNSADPENSYLFGKDAFNLNSSTLRHVHIVPLLVKQDLEKWDLAWSRYARRTSDRYLFYADGGAREGFLLISILDDPGAHTIWNSGSHNQQLLNAWEQIAENFTIHGLIADL